MKFLRGFIAAGSGMFVQSVRPVGNFKALGNMT